MGTPGSGDWRMTNPDPLMRGVMPIAPSVRIASRPLAPRKSGMSAGASAACGCAGSDVTRKKPAPDIFLKAAEKAGIEPHYALVIEDALSGVKAAKAAGALCAAVTTSFDAERLREAGADFVCDDLTNIAEKLLCGRE